VAVKVIQLIAKDALRHDHAPRAEHLLALDDRGRIWERFSDDDEGRWTIVPGPRNPPTKQRRKARRT